jgi:hypothetical protein
VVINISGLKIGEDLDIERVYRAREIWKNAVSLQTYIFSLETQMATIAGDYGSGELDNLSLFWHVHVNGFGERNLLGTGVNIYGGVRFLRLTDKKILGFLPQPESSGGD